MYGNAVSNQKIQRMNKTLIVLILTTLGFYCYGQNDQSTKIKVTDDVKSVDTITLDESRINSKTHEFNYIDTEANYTDSVGKGIIIQNGFPRGGGRLYSSNDISYGHAVFWSRVVNMKDTPLKITINFSADPTIIFPSSNGHIKLLVPQDTMTIDKVSKYGYGLKNLRTFVESNFHQSSQIQRTINPKEDCIFYVVLLSHFSSSDEVIGRTGLFLKGQDLFYRLTIDSSTSKLIPCGRIAFENEDDN